MRTLQLCIAALLALLQLCRTPAAASGSAALGWQPQPQPQPAASSSSASLSHHHLPLPDDDYAVDASTQSWLLAIRLLDGRRASAHLPLVGRSVLAHARLQSCRPALPPDPHLLPPSLRGSDTDPRLPYPQLECVHVWGENWLLQSNSAGIAPLSLHVPASRLAGSDSPALMDASTRSLQLKLKRMCPVYTASDELWMAMTGLYPGVWWPEMLEAARARGEREWDAQGIVALLINSPAMPHYEPAMETRQVLVPFNAIEPIHELDLGILPNWSLPGESVSLAPHPFLPAESMVAQQLTLAQQLHRHVSALSSWLHLFWMLPLSVATALALLQLPRRIRRSRGMKRAARGCRELVELLTDVSHGLHSFWHYQREHIQWTSGIRQQVELARRKVDGMMPSSSGIREACARAVSSLSRLHPRSLLIHYALPLYQLAESSLESASTRFLSPVVDTVTVNWPAQLLLLGHAGVARVWSLADAVRQSRVLKFVNEVSNMVTSAVVSVVSPSPPPPAPFDYSPSPSPSRSSPTPIRSASPSASPVPSAASVDVSDVESEIGLGSPHRRPGDGDAWSHRDDGVERFHDLVQRQISDTSTGEESSRRRRRDEGAEGGERKVQSESPPLRNLRMRVWKEQEEKRASEPHMKEVAYLFQYKPRRRDAPTP